MSKIIIVQFAIPKAHFRKLFDFYKKEIICSE